MINIFNNSLKKLNEEKAENINPTLEKAKKEIEKAQNIYLFAHEHPDGDAIGSLVALQLVLKSLGKNVKTYVKEIPQAFTYLPEVNNFVTSIEENIDLVIALDTADIKRLDGMVFFKYAKRSILIDHHTSNKMFADINIVDPTSPANAQILASIFEYFNIELTTDIFNALMVGIITDTGGFQYQSMQPETFEFAAKALRCGIDIPGLYRKSLMTISKARFELTTLAQNRLELLEDGKIALTYINLEDEKNINADSMDAEGIVNVGKQIDGVELSIFIRQKDEETYRISLRSNDYVDTTKITQVFGGGRHIRASGCKITGSYETVKQKILDEAKIYLNE